MSVMIDLYCERTDPGVWAEPLNAVSNLCFVVTAFAAWRWLAAGSRQPIGRQGEQQGGQQGGQADWSALRGAGSTLAVAPVLLVLTGLLALIGLGSGAFHLFATRTTLLMDVVPIALFQWVYLAAYTRLALGYRWPVVGLWFLAFVTLTLVFRLSPLTFNGSIGYFSSLVMLTVFAGLTPQPLRRRLLLAIGLFVGSLFFRSIDHAVCGWLSVGTHFLWHVLNSVVLYLLIVHLAAVSQWRR